MIDKKCKMCGDPAEWEWNSEFYCECCLGIELCIYIIDPPLRCKQCGTPFEGSYFTDDDDDNVFCSRACALEYNDAKKLDEEESDNESGN